MKYLAVILLACIFGWQVTSTFTNEVRNAAKAERPGCKVGRIVL